MIKLIVAFDKNWLIGIKDQLPWKIEEDLLHFKKTTQGKTIVMGDVTFFGLPIKPLPKRKTIVLTLNKNLKFPLDVDVCHDYKKLVQKYQNNSKKDIYVCGGKTIYALFLPFCDELIISHLKKEYQGDTYFPRVDLTKYKISKEKEYKDFIVKYYCKK